MLGIQHRRASLAAAVALIAGLSGPAAWAADSIVLVGPGGLVNKAIREVYAAPFQQATGVEVIVADWGQTLGELRAQVDSSKGAWDIVMIDQYAVDAACKEELLEKFDWAKIKTDGLIDVAVQPCGVGIQGWGAIVAYNGDRVASPPKSLQDFFDVQRWPGQNIALNMDVRGTLEFALMADGVSVNDVYKVLATPAGVERAFKKLDEIKSQVVWWKSGAQPIQLLASGEVVMTSAYNGRVSAANRTDKKNFKVVWPGSIYAVDSWVVLKNSANKGAGMDYIAFASAPENQKNLPEYIAYGLTNKAAVGMVDAKYQAELPTTPANAEGAIPINANFWVENIDKLTERFNAWAAK